MFSQGQFTNDANATPESIARKRALIAALMPKFGSARYVGEGLGQLATGVMIGRQNKKLDGAEAAGRQSADELFSALIGGASPGTSPGGSTGSYSGGGTPSGTWTPAPPAPKATETYQGMPDVVQGGLSFGNLPAADTGVAQGGGDFGAAVMTPQEMLIEGAKRRGLDPVDVATAISYETGGTFDPLIKGPTTQWGSHEGLIQFGDPQGQEHGAVFDQGPEAAWRSQLNPDSGAVWSYLDSVGVQPGMGLDQIYSGINAGGVNRMGASDANNGGAPGTVADKVAGMGDHRENAAKFLGGTWTPDPNVTASTSGPASPPAAPQDGAPQIPMQDLLAAMANPWLAPEQKAVLQSMYEQQVQAGDPMRQLELQKAQMEVDAMRNPTEQPPADFTERMFTLDALGIDRQSEEGKYYIMTGELPEPPKPGYRPMTPEEGAKLGVNPAEYQVSPENKIEKIGGGGVTVNNNSGGGKFEEEFAKGDAATVETVYNSGLAAQRNIGRIDQLDAILSQNPTGFGASLAQIAGEWGIPSEGLDEIQTAQAIINSLVPEQRQPGSGPMSDADLALFKQSLPRIIGQPDGNKMLIDTMRGIAEYDAEGARIVQRMRLPEGDPNRLTRAQAFDALQNRVNPLSEIKGVAGEATPDADGWTTINGVKIRVKQ